MRKAPKRIFPAETMDAYAMLRRAGKRQDYAAAEVNMLGLGKEMEAALRRRRLSGGSFSATELDAAIEAMKRGKHVSDAARTLNTPVETLRWNLRRHRTAQYDTIMVARGQKRAIPKSAARPAPVCACATVDEIRAWALQFRPNARCMSVPEINALRRMKGEPQFEVVVSVEARGPGAWAAQHGLPDDASLAVINSLRRRRKLPAFVVVRPARSVEARAA